MSISSVGACGASGSPGCGPVGRHRPAAKWYIIRTWPETISWSPPADVCGTPLEFETLISDTSASLVRGLAGSPRLRRRARPGRVRTFFHADRCALLS